MPEPPEEQNLNPIVALATRLRNRRDLESAIDSALETAPAAKIDTRDVTTLLAALGADLQVGAKRLNSILGERDGVRFVRLERPLRLRLRFGDKRIALDVDETRQLVIITGEGLDGEYQFDSAAAEPALMNLSKLSTEAGYRDLLTASSLLKTIAQDAQLPRPAHLDGPGPISL